MGNEHTDDVTIGLFSAVHLKPGSPGNIFVQLVSIKYNDVKQKK